MSKIARFGFSGVLLVAVLAGLVPGVAVGEAQAQNYRLGFSGKDLPGEGVEVVAVNPGSPATRLYRTDNAQQPITLTPGDVITAVDGRPVRSLAEYYQAMNAATPGKVKITVRDVSNGQMVELATRAALGGLGPTLQPSPPGAGGLAKICVLLIADTNAERIGPSVRVDLENMTTLFKANVPVRQLRLIKLVGNDVSRRNILAEIRAMGNHGLVAGQDTLVIYYSGHGAYSLQAADHMMTTSNGILYFHRDIEAAASQVRPRATVILSDACGVLIMGQPAAGAPALEPPEKTPPLFASLFLDLPSGVTAISSAMKGQTAGCNSTLGGYFTLTLCDTLRTHLDERLQWKDVLHELNGQIKILYPNTHQVAYVIGNAGGADPSPRFGVVAEATPRGRQSHGVEVTRVLNGYPAQALHHDGEAKNYVLVPGRDVIQRINGKAVSDYAEFVNAVRNSPTQMTVTVYDTTTGQTDEFKVTLRD
jgi:hypothetical protein